LTFSEPLRNMPVPFLRIKLNVVTLSHAARQPDAKFHPFLNVSQHPNLAIDLAHTRLLRIVGEFYLLGEMIGDIMEKDMIYDKSRVFFRSCFETYVQFNFSP